MEYGLRLTRPVDLPNDPRETCPSGWRSLLPQGPAVALYFGTEFCEDRLPSALEAEEFCSLARDTGLAATLLTPLVSPRGLRAVAALLEALGGRGWAPAVVFNDWGVLGLLRDAHSALPRRAGRLMNRSLRDPRAFGAVSPSGFSGGHDPSRSRRLRQFLASVGVSALETDPDLDGGFLGDGAEGLARALHLPYVFATSGRSCPAKAALYPEGQGFAKAFADPCPAPCRAGPVAVARKDSPISFERAGNTLFYEIPQAVAQAWLPSADRIVLHAEASP